MVLWHHAATTVFVKSIIPAFALSNHSKISACGDIFPIFVPISVWSAAGRGETFFTYDALGNMLWSTDSEGNQTITGSQLTPEKSFSAQVRKNKSGGQLTTGLTTELNVLGLPISQIEFGNGFERKWTVVREDNGHARTAIGADASRTEYKRHLLGWPTKISELTDVVPPLEFDHTILAYNKRGQLEFLTDPAQQVTQWTYNVFGNLESVTLPGTPVIKRSYTYDALGRLETESLGKYQLKHQYDHRGDLFTTDYRQGTSPYHLLKKTHFDELGRNVESVYDNVLLTHLTPAER